MEISNKPLAVLLVVAIVISIGGAMMTITQVTNLVNIFPALSGITGLGTSGRVNVTVATLASYTIVRPNLEFGVGSVAAGNQYAILESNGSQTGSPAASWTVSGNTWVAQDIQILNLGTVGLNITLSSGSNGTTMIGGGAGSIPDPWVRFNASDNETAGACGIIGTSSTGIFNTTEITLPSTKYYVCENLSYIVNKNSMNLSFQLLVPQDAVAGNKTAAITFTGVQSPGNA